MQPHDHCPDVDAKSQHHQGHLGPARGNKRTHGLPKGSVLEGLPKFRSVFDGGLARRQKLELEESVTDVVLFACVVGVRQAWATVCATRNFRKCFASGDQSRPSRVDDQTRDYRSGR